jgi:hypothetical protein
MPTVPPLSITDGERAELQRRVRAHTTPQRAAKRARVVLLAAEGVPMDLPPGGGHRGYAAVVDGSRLMVACCCSHSMGDR